MLSCQSLVDWVCVERLIWWIRQIYVDVLVWHLNLSDILCYNWTFGRFEHDIMSKSGAGDARGGCFCVSFEISRNVDFRKLCSRDFSEFYFLGVLWWSHSGTSICQNMAFGIYRRWKLNAILWINLVLDTPGSIIIVKISQNGTFELYMSRDFGDEL